MTSSPQPRRGKGRVFKPDDRDRKYLLPVRKKSDRTSRSWYVHGAAYDQGQTSQCVAYSSARWLDTNPVVNRWRDTGWTFEQLYKMAQRADPFPGEDYPGTTVRAAMKVLKDEGYISEYNWAFSIDPAVVHLLEDGPMVIGIDWFPGMDEVDRHGYIWPTGVFDGMGHATTLVGVNRTRRNPDGTRGAVRICNSWGMAWGQAGRAWMSFDVLDQLIRNNGEAATATEIVRKRAA